MRLGKISILLVILLTGIPTHSQDVNRYEFESAYAEKTSTTNSTGVEIIKTEKIYITEFGKKEAHYIIEKRNISISGKNQVEESKSVSIIEGEWMINYDPDKKTGTKMRNPYYDSFKGKSEEELKKFADQMGKAMNTEVNEVGTEEILGKSCKVSEGVTDMMGMKTTTKTWMYKNFILKLNSDGMGTKFNEIITKFDEGEKIDADKLKVPSDVKITEMKLPN